MRALLLAAGLGTRLRPLTDTVPKCLVKINGRPLLDHWIHMLIQAGIKNILINLHHLPDLVADHLVASNYEVNIKTVMEDRLLSTGGTLLKNREFFRGEPIILIHADNLSSFDFAAFMERFNTRQENIEITMMTFKTDSPTTCGIVELDSRGVVRAFYEKVASPPGNLANAAVYILAPTVIDFIAGLNQEVVDFSTEVLPEFIGRINTYHNDIYHRDIGNIESLMAAQREYPNAIAHR